MLGPMVTEDYRQKLLTGTSELPALVLRRDLASQAGCKNQRAASRREKKLPSSHYPRLAVLYPRIYSSLTRRSIILSIVYRAVLL